MATNKYFINYNSRHEQTLVEDLMIETIKIHGFDLFYLPREIMSTQNIFGDDPTSQFRQHFVIEMYMQNVDQFEGEGDFVGKFGLEIRDSATFVVSKKRFRHITGKFRPLEGDILYFPLAKKFFEIKFVEHENPFYQAGKNYVFSLSVELFEYSQEKFKTQLPDIDEAATRRRFSISLSISSLSGNLFVGDEVFTLENGSSQGLIANASGKAKIQSFDPETSIVVLTEASGTWKQSNSTQDFFLLTTTGSFAKIDGRVDSVEDNLANDNQKIDEKSEVFLDFSERNPFGDPLGGFFNV
jgi:hypothetical protein